MIPVDGGRNNVYATAISMEKLRDLSNRIAAKHVIYVMDSCYSGLGFTRGIVRKAPGTPSNRFIEKVTSQRAVQMITAGGEGEQSIEVGGAGLFTSYFLRAIGGEADMDSDGFVTLSEIGTFVKPGVTRGSDGRQTPQFGSVDGSGEVVLQLGPLQARGPQGAR